MKLFLFESIEKVSDRYHEDGGLVVVAKDKDSAIDMINERNDVEVTEKEWENVVTYELSGYCDPIIYTFPDAGCC